MDSTPLIDLAPALRLLLLAGLVALLPLAWIWLRRRGQDSGARIAALTAVTLFLTFDLIVFGAFTRLSDSGLGCPDWPGCYGQASPLGAHADIQAAQTAQPHGPVTLSKAWIEMIHRYLAMTVGALILAIAAVSWAGRRWLPHSPWWPTVTLIWVIVQGLFGKYTVTLKLYPAVVTAHLLGGMLLLALLMMQHETWRARSQALTLQMSAPRPADADRPPRGSRKVAKPHFLESRCLVLVMLLLWAQIALGGWVSTNYAVLACDGLPTCNGEWWPAMNFGEAFHLLRELGRTGQGGYLSLEALVAIQMAHRLMALALFVAVSALVAALWRGDKVARRYALALGLLTLAQAATGISNVVLGWPIAAALLHSAGAAALVAVSTSLWARGRRGVRVAAVADSSRRVPA